MHRYRETVKADVRRRMSPLHRQSVVRISEKLGIHEVTLDTHRRGWKLEGQARCGAGTSPIRPPPCAGYGSTSTW
jgi:hypothetical protein